MADAKRRGTLVYSTGGAVCAACEEPAVLCRCAASAAPEPVPARVTAHLRLETKGRGGKSVTVVDRLPRNPGYVAELVRELKRALGTGGTAGDGRIELQGDRRDRLRELLRARGIAVRG